MRQGGAKLILHAWGYYVLPVIADGEIPGPIPNPEVKPIRVRDSVRLQALQGPLTGRTLMLAQAFR